MRSPRTSADDQRKSSKRSGANRRRRSPERQHTYYIDENLGKIVPAKLIERGYDVRPWYDHYPGASDVEYLPPIGALKWVLITKDQNIRRNQLEISAILNSGVRAFVLTGGNLSGDAQAELLLNAMPKIARISVRRGPYVFTISRTGIFKEIAPRTLRRAAQRRRVN